MEKGASASSGKHIHFPRRMSMTPKSAKKGEMLALLATLLQPESGSLSPWTLFMSTPATRFDNRIKGELLRRGIALSPEFDQQEKKRLLPEIQKVVFSELLSEDADRFLFEISVPMHEKKHFIDIVSTTFGHDMFVQQWEMVNRFHQTLKCIVDKGFKLRIPIRQWIEQRNCPSEIQDFVREYDDPGNGLRRLTPPKLVRAEVGKSDRNNRDTTAVVWQGRPYIVRKTGDGAELIQITVRGILESLAWLVQLRFMVQHDYDAMLAWKDLATTNIVYGSVLSVAESCYYGTEAALNDLLEFCLLTPHRSEYAKNALDEKQFDPAWRFYYLVNLLEESPELMLNEAIIWICKEHKWLSPEQVIVEALSNTPTISDMPGIWCFSDHPALQNVIRSFHHYFFGAMRLRLRYGAWALEREDEADSFDNEVTSKALFPLEAADSPIDLEWGAEPVRLPLLGDIMERLLISDRWNPPIHLVSEPDGTMHFADSPNRGVHPVLDLSGGVGAHESWEFFYFLSSVMDDAMLSDTIRCPLPRPKAGAALPGDCTCTCGLQRSTCYVAELMRGLSVERL